MSKISLNFKLFLVAITTGLLAGLFSSLFLHSLNWVTNIRANHHYLIFGLPLFGFLFGQILKRIPTHVNQGVAYFIKEIDNEKSNISPWMTPFIFLSSLGTHVFGGSAGREGVGVIMGASAAHFPSFRIPYSIIRPYLIYCGMAAGFSSIFGTPIAGIIFSFELQEFRDIKNYALLITTILSSYTALFVAHFLGPVSQQFKVSIPDYSDLTIYILIATLTSGLAGQIFYWGLKGYEKIVSRILSHVEWKLFWGALLIALVVYFSASYDYIGIGTHMIAKSFSEQMSVYDFALKCLLTIMTISIGFKGGEVTPLFFMGATFSNSIAGLFSLKNFSFSSALGMVSLFGAVTGTPLTSTVMGLELFGWKVGLFTLPCCYLARWLMKDKSIYKI